MMDIEITCWADDGIGEQFNFRLNLPDNTKRAKISVQQVGEAKQVVVEEIEFYENGRLTQSG